MVFLAEAFFSGCISKAINDSKDCSWAKIKNALNDKNNCSLSTKIYCVIERTLNIVTYNKFKDTDDLFNAIETIFNEFKDNGNTQNAVKCGLRVLGSGDSVVSIESFLEKFYDGICQDDDLYKRISLILQEKGIEINRDGFQRINEKLDSLGEKISSKSNDEFGFQKRKPVKSRTQEYADKWDANMFLNDFDKRDQNAGTNVKLKEVYLEEHLPHYIWYKNNENDPSTDLKELLSEYINDKRNSRMLLILGQPGIGKSTLITWITANLCERIDDILVYRFASDLRNVDWKDGKISNRVLEELGLSHSDLNGKTLIIDGFDEVSIESNRRRDVLDSFYGDWINNKTIEDFSLIITCRENYVSQFAIRKYKYITLKPWDEIQIRSFCDIFQKKTKNSVSMDTIEKLLENKEILGIPLILYMTLALDISIEKEGSIVDIYDKIFSLDGGIYDRCIDNKNFETKHRIGEVKKEIHQISREIAIWMFENEPEDVYIPQKVYYCICDNIAKTSKRENENYVHDFLIGNFVQLNHCEGIKTERISFVHRSIYEYFVAETIYSSIEGAMIALSDISQIELAENIVVYLKRGSIEHTIGEFLKHKILKLYTHLDYEKQCKFYQWWEEALDKMINVGMFYYKNKSAKYYNYKNIINKEIKCFVNILKIIQSLFEKSNREYMLLNVNRTNLEKYLKYTSIEHLIFELNLSRMNLAEIDLREVDLHGVNLQSSNLTKANLEGKKLEGINLCKAFLCKANLTNTNLEGANLTDAHLEEAKIDGINLKNAIVKRTVLDENQLQYLEKVFRYKMVAVKVFVSECNKIYDYESYQRFRKMKKKNKKFLL